MSFAEEPIRASKPFIEKEPTETPEIKSTTINATESHKGNSNKAGLNLIPTSQPLKSKSEKSTLIATEMPKENASVVVNIIVSGTTEISNTPVEESHEIYNNDKDREIFQDSISPPQVKKSIKLEVVENVGNSLKNIVSKSSESQEDQSSDRAYNIEGTFETNDFSNIEPINVYKKIDMIPLENSENPTLETTVKSIDEIEKSSSSKSSGATKLATKSPATSSPLTTKTLKINTTPSITSTTVDQQSSTSTPNLIILEARNETGSIDYEDTKKRSSLLSGVEDNDNEKNFSSRKRRIINTERHSFYPYFLGRIWGWDFETV